MPNEELDAFLSGNAAPEPAAEPTAPEPVAAEPATAPAPEPADADDDPPLPTDPLVPLSALQKERAGRQDYKSKWLREEGERKAADAKYQGELAALKTQLEELKRAPPPVAQPTAPVQQITVPNPVEDPVAYHAFMQQQNAEALFNERLNMSEAALRDKHGDADVDAKLGIFKKAAEANPALKAELRKQVNPYKWVYDQASRMQAMEEVGTDPAAYRAKVEAELRAKWEAERDATPAPAAPVVNLPQSLSTARSAQSRATPVDTGPTPLEVLFPQR